MKQRSIFKLKAVPVRNPKFIKIKLSDSVIFSAGSIEMLCRKYKVGRPLLDGMLPQLIQDKYRLPVTEITSTRFKHELTKLSDSRYKVRFV